MLLCEASTEASKSSAVKLFVGLVCDVLVALFLKLGISDAVSFLMLFLKSSVVAVGAGFL